ncbi:MAG: ferritin-like domain-containing protein [Acidobacteriota bacterium]
MGFETTKDVYDWYDRQRPVFTKEGIASIPWSDVNKYPLDERFIPVLLYMRDVETLTDMYHREMLRTPTGKDPYIGRFMERWGQEEVIHGEVLNRFLNEAGVETGDKWQHQVRKEVSKFYSFNTYILTSLTNLLGRKFTATHMAFGAIHEMSTAQAYRRMDELAGHPVLSIILNGIMREESFHTHFYWSVAKLELRNSEAAQRIAHFVIKNFYRPVGEGSIPRKRTEYTIKTLFGGEDGLERLDKTVTRRAQLLPGLEALTKVTDTIGRITNQSLTETA